MTTDPLRGAANALRYWEVRQQTVANNLANTETPGFKGERTFAQLLDGTLRTGAVTDFGQGSLRPTGNPLDLALHGDGFFVVATPAGERLTRGGAFGLDANGRIVDTQGSALLGEEGELIVPPGTRLTIDAEGMLYADDKQVDRLRIASVADPEQLRHEAAGRFRVEGAAVALDPAERRVLQGHLEDANVHTLESMVEMIRIQRAWASVQGSLRTIDSVMDTVANQIGRVS